MKDLFEHLPLLIREAAVSPLGIFALMIILLSIISFFFFHKSSEKVKLTIFSVLLLGTIAFAFAISSSRETIVDYSGAQQYEDVTTPVTPEQLESHLDRWTWSMSLLGAWILLTIWAGYDNNTWPRLNAFVFIPITTIILSLVWPLSGNITIAFVLGAHLVNLLITFIREYGFGDAIFIGFIPSQLLLFAVMLSINIWIVWSIS